jgi:AsmA family protein
MRYSVMARQRLLNPSTATLAIALALGVALLVVLGALALDSRWLGMRLIQRIAADSNRAVRIDGPVHTHLFSLSPWLTAEGVTIGNPPWSPPGTAARIGKIVLFLRWSSLRHPLTLHALALRAAAVALTRDPAGRSNWQWSAPGSPTPRPPPMINGLAVPDADVRFDDAVLNLHFAGTVSAGPDADASGRRPARLEGTGQLNGRPVRFSIAGDRLATTRRNAPYRFTFDETSSGSHLTGRGVLPRPFDVTQLEATFQAQGEDLKDLYFLTGVSLTDTGAYRLSGDLQRQGPRLTFRNLMATSGGSDMSGSIAIQSQGGSSFVRADLRSGLLRLKDLGTRAAGREPALASPSTLLFSNTPLGLRRFRRTNASVRFEAHRLAFGRMELRDAEAQIAFGRGTVLVEPLSATLAAGKLAGDLRINVAGEEPEVSVNLRANDVHLAELGERPGAQANTAPPALEGPLEARLTMSGRGDSPHTIAATADGQFVAIVPHGAIRASIAELAGLDFIRLLGLRLGTSQNEATVRCAIASVRARAGILNTERLLIDTGPALITGHGEIRLDSEALDLSLHDQPTHVRLLAKRVPVRIGGTLEHPSVSVAAPGKIGATAALGAVLAPVDALLHLIKPDLTYNSDCAAVLAQGEREAAKAGDGTSRR